MAEVVTGAFLSAFFQALFDRLASEEFRGKKPVVGVLDELKVVLISANKLLSDAEDKQIGDDNVRMWLDELTQVIYDADDLVDTIDSKDLWRKMEGKSGSGDASNVLKKLVNFFDGFDNTVKNEATKILGRLKILVEQKDALGLREGDLNRSSQRPPAPLAEESSVYGRKDDKESIVNLLLSDDDTNGNKISVIPIVGMGGIGKTTLAQIVYNDERVDKHFELKAWVTVSDEFDVFKITKIIFEKVTSKNCDIKDLFELQQKLKEALQGKKFLFVHDDVWNENYDLWDALKSSFESAAKGSKIIVTTRSTDVASKMADGKTHHNLTVLSTEDCWKLFARHAFGANADPDAYQDLQLIGREVVNKCKGVPLAVKSLGGLLCSEKNPQKWEDILNSDVWAVLYKKGNILPALWLSYRHLPAHLKRCFAYCSIFPKDYEFEKERIVLLWMAEGFLQSDKQAKTMEALGEEYFDDLLSRSLFQQSSPDESIFLMHDLVHDLAMFISGDFCFSLNHSNDFQKLASKTRHLSCTYLRGSPNSRILEDLSKAKNLRTFITYSIQGEAKLVLHNSLLTAGRCLRALSLRGSSIKELSSSVANMTHLRYLDLSLSEIRELPNSVCTLYNLQTLLLSYCGHLTVLPKNMESLINLRHLDIQYVPLKEMPLQIHNMKALQTVSSVILGDGHSRPKINVLKEVQPFCGVLKISRIENVANAAEALEANLKHNHKGLKDLVLSWSAESAAHADSSVKEKEVLDALRPHTNLRSLQIDFYRGAIFSDWIGHDSFSKLHRIRLRNCKSCSVLPPLGQLPSLKDLEISEFDCVVSIGDEICGNGPPFRSLESLRIGSMLEWKEWSFSVNIKGPIFPRLTKLELCGCPKFKMELHGHDQSLDHLRAAFPSLVDTYVSCCPLLDSLQEWIPLSIKKLDISNCKNIFANCANSDLQRLSFSCLESLSIFELEDVSFPDDGLLPTGLASLSIEYCENLEALNGKAFQQLTSLTKLEISGCPKLRRLPEEGLPTSLSYLTIYGLKDVSFPDDGLLPTSLARLQIGYCKNLEALNGKAFQQLTSLTELGIFYCPKLRRLPEEGLPTSLSYLRIIGLKDVSFPDDGLLPTSLARLQISNCENLEALNGKAFQQLTSLTKLTITDCPKLRRLPEEGLPTSLSYIAIRGCPLLKQRCQKDGEDWPSIAHIASVSIL